MDEIFYELFYRGAKKRKATNDEITVNLIKTDIKRVIHCTLKEFSYIKPTSMHEYDFANIEYSPIPIFDIETQQVFSIKYEPISLYKNIRDNLYEYVKNYQNYFVSNLPLIDVANYLGIKVQATMSEEFFGQYSPTEKIIYVGSDYKPTFLHELAHAIDGLLGNNSNVKEIDEVTAELSSVVLCKIFNIPVNINYSKLYINWQGRAAEYIDTCIVKNELSSLKPILKRVKKICEYVVKCKEVMYCGKYGA